MLTCTARTVTYVSYLNYSPNPLDNWSLRWEYYHDIQGQRTGTATRYYGVGASWTHFFKQNVFIRPEMVYYTALDNPAFAQGTKFTQLVAAFDLIVRF